MTDITTETTTDTTTKKKGKVQSWIYGWRKVLVALFGIGAITAIAYAVYFIPTAASGNTGIIGLMLEAIKSIVYIVGIFCGVNAWKDLKKDTTTLTETSKS